MGHNDLPRRDQVIDLLRSSTRALHAREIAERLAVREGAYLRLLELLGDMSMDRVIRALPGQRFRSQAEAAAEAREGVITIHPRGFGFVSCTGYADDVFIPEAATGGALHGDVVRVRVAARTRRGTEGWVEGIVARGVHRVQGVIRRRGASVWLDPDDARVRGPVVLPGPADAWDGQAAVVRLTRYPQTRDENPEGEVIALLGVPGDPVVEMQKVLIREQIEEAFPPEVEDEAAAMPDPWPASVLDNRRDLRGLDFITIDPDDARDHDDAIFVEQTSSGFDVWVAIADVAQYVVEGSALDREARRRAFSTYLPDRAVPMLPQRLSSDLCSLRQGVDRLCLAVHLEMDRKGVVRSSDLVEAVMCSRARLAYSGVARAMGWSDAAHAPAHLDDRIERGVRDAARLATILRRRRLRRGALDLLVPEPQVLLDSEGKPVDVRRRQQDLGVRRAYGLIEELMIAANETVARWMASRGLGAIHRVHAPPDEDKLDRLVQMCSALGLAFDPEDAADPKLFSAFLQSIERHPLAEVIGALALRSLKQASYDPVNIGHFGLASPAYLHFTSPIRRYPDLQVHRIVKRALHGGDPTDEAALGEIASYCTRRERAVAAVEREVVDLYRALLMRNRIGDRLEGTVIDVDDNRVIVAMDEPFVDVRVGLDRLGAGVYEVMDDGLGVEDRRGGGRIRLGDRMWVEVESVSLERRAVAGRRIDEKQTFRTNRNARESSYRERTGGRNQSNFKGKRRAH